SRVSAMKQSGQYNYGICALVSWLAPVLLMFASSLASANNITVTNILLTQSFQVKTCRVRFDISWDNSWRNVVNHDAAWVFMKYSADNGASWHHATMKTAGNNPLGFAVDAGANLDIIVPADKKGAFLQRPTGDQAQGRVASQRVRLVWDFNADGLSATNVVKIKVYAVEMVYIPQGSFCAGSGGSGANEFTLTQINTANASSSGGYPDGQAAPNASWPNGYSRYYAMKYEISQGLYRDFLNSLTGAQSANRCLAASAGDFMCGAAGVTTPQNRNGIQKQAGGYVCNLDNDSYNNEGEDGESIACNWLNWADLAAFADWAALRPMTELEYEKVCRGASANVPNEYPWGSATTCRPARGIAGGGYAGETPTNAGNYANCTATNHPLVQGPMRCGAFAGSVTQTTRMQAGASYYGNMELAGNVWERCVTIGHATGLTYTGVHGDGVLTAGGDADADDWPGTDAVGAGARGGAWQDDRARLMTSDRQNAAGIDAARTAAYGGRCVRTAP
ncbi:MAG: SUMF1/EgtB/PvdO family nonheme iron enzyme, partial [Kiritimatiellia bacterium]|nr:SUMF1/EgtB/PvdO family nonheme iron enzyme [Kiritimatiellia bacterium]